MKSGAKEVSPRKVLAEVAAAISADVHPNIIIIGSLAAGFWLFQGYQSFGVRTKDIDYVLSPLSGPLLADGLLLPMLGSASLEGGRNKWSSGSITCPQASRRGLLWRRPCSTRQPRTECSEPSITLLSINRRKILKLSQATRTEAA